MKTVFAVIRQTVSMSNHKLSPKVEQPPMLSFLKYSDHKP